VKVHMLIVPELRCSPANKIESICWCEGQSR